MTAISQQQAWCKLAIAIAEGPEQHAPRAIDFYPADEEKYPGLPPAIDITVDSASALWWWADRLGCTIDDPRPHGNTGRWHQVARTAYQGPHWHGCQVTVKTYDASTLGEPVDSMAAVRALAEQPDTCVCCSPGDCGDRDGHVRNDRDGGDTCNCGRDWPCEKAA